jgi:hypothetical protein
LEERTDPSKFEIFVCGTVQRLQNYHEFEQQQSQKHKKSAYHKSLVTKGGTAGVQSPTKRNFRKTDFVDMKISKVLRDLRFSINQPPKSADDWYIGILKNIIKSYEYVDFCLF